MTHYDLILADPPWHFTNYAADEPGLMHDRSRGANRHYPTMTTGDICQMPVADMVADDAVLLMWATWPHLPDSLRVIEAWGFEYKTLAWVWVKANPSGFGHYMGMGYWTRSNSEPCLLGVRGKGLRRKSKGVLSLIYSAVREHSRKPDEQYDKIAALFGEDIRCLEMFARRERPGWDVYGNEVDGTVQIPAVTP